MGNLGPGAENSAESGVSIELLGWVRTFVGGEAQGSQVYYEAVEPGDTLRLLLQRFSARHAVLYQALWDPHNLAEIGPHIEVIFNDAILGMHATLETVPQQGDHVLLAGQYMGG